MYKYDTINPVITGGRGGAAQPRGLRDFHPESWSAVHLQQPERGGDLVLHMRLPFGNLKLEQMLKPLRKRQCPVAGPCRGGALNKDKAIVVHLDREAADISMPCCDWCGNKQSWMVVFAIDSFCGHDDALKEILEIHDSDADGHSCRNAEDDGRLPGGEILTAGDLLAFLPTMNQISRGGYLPYDCVCMCATDTLYARPKNETRGIE